MDRLQGLIQTFFISVVIALTITPAPTLAQTWPQRPVRVIVPIGPGSSPDVAARTFAERLAVHWAQPVVIENRTGADGLTGTIAFTAAHDDHMLLFAPASPVSVYPLIQEKLPYDPVRDVLPVSTVVETFGTIAVPTSLPVANLTELVNFARTRPGQLTWATGGGAFPILMSAFMKSEGLETVHVPYRDQNLAVQDAAQGRVQIFATAMTAVLPLIQAGKIRVLAVTNKKRSPAWPDIPTATESGYPHLAFDGLIGMFAPHGTPDDRRERISADIRAIAADEGVAKRLNASGQIVRGSTPAEFGAAIEQQRATLAALAQRTGASRH
jgi:tripartite-type tricarboxylate transporter receptor subunit TctC